jgi:hypothetical protein
VDADGSAKEGNWGAANCMAKKILIGGQKPYALEPMTASKRTETGDIQEKNGEKRSWLGPCKGMPGVSTGGGSGGGSWGKSNSNAPKAPFSTSIKSI